MKSLFSLASPLAARVNCLIHQSESADPDMREVAAMVYVGDVYALREQAVPSHDNGSSRHRYADEYVVDL